MKTADLFKYWDEELDKILREAFNSLSQEEKTKLTIMFKNDDLLNRILKIIIKENKDETKETKNE